MKQSKLIKTENAIETIKKQLADIGDMRMGSLSQQSRKVKKAYGSYWHLSYSHLGKGHTEYIRNNEAKRIKKEVANYKRFKILVDRLITLSIIKSKIKTELERSASD